MITNIFLGSTELTSANRFIVSVKNGGFPEVDYSTTKKGGYSGRKISPGKFSSYKFVLEWQVVGSSFSDLTTQKEIFIALLGQIISSGSKILRIDRANGTDLQIEVKGIDVVTDVSTADPLNSHILTEMEAEYPFLVGVTELVETAFIFEGGGMEIPMAIPMDMSGGGGGGEITMANDGNYEAFPRFLFAGPLTTPTLTNVTTGKVLNVNTSLATFDDKLEVDVFLRTARFLPSGTNARRYISGDFWTMAIGNNTIKLGSASFNTTGRASIYFRSHWLNI